MSGPFISPRAIKIINLIITTVMVSYESWRHYVIEIITSFWWVIVFTCWIFSSLIRFVDFSFFIFVEFLFWMWRSKEKWVFSHSNLSSKRLRILFFFLCAFCLDQLKSSISLWAPPWMNEKTKSEKKKLKISRRKKLWLIKMTNTCAS